MLILTSFTLLNKAPTLLRPFSKKEIQTVRRTWRLVEPQNERATEIFYRNLFAAKPELRLLFKRDKSHTITEAIGRLVDGMDNLPDILPYVQKLAVMHVHFGVKKADYKLAGPVFIKTLKDLLGSEFTAGDEIVWNKIYRVLSGVMTSYAYPQRHTIVFSWLMQTVSKVRSA